MADEKNQQRRKLYFNLSAELAQMDNARLRSMFADSEPRSSWGKDHVIEVGRSKVFVKRVPVTDIEYENMFSTRNLYDLPTYYNYGVGSAGLGVFRELVTHVKTTNWVLAGEIATFPLMYHYRIVPFEGERAEVDLERHARYVKYWGSNANIGRYMLDRANAKYELVLFLEYIPYTVGSWLAENPGKIAVVFDDMRSTVAFLRSHGIIHFDNHFYNVVTDGKRAYLTDFGLALDRGFELTPEEKRFYRENSYYDYGLLAWSLLTPLAGMYRALGDESKKSLADKYGIEEGAASDEVVSALLDEITDLAANGPIKLSKSYTASLVRYRDIMKFMNSFYSELQSNPAKDTRFDQAKLRRLLKQTDFALGGDLAG